MAPEMYFSTNDQMGVKIRVLEYVSLYEYCSEIQAMVMGARPYPDCMGLANGCTQAFISQKEFGCHTFVERLSSVQTEMF
jgi:hypothetical protein